MPDSFYMPEGCCAYESQDSCDGCCFDISKDKTISRTCDFARIADPVIKINVVNGIVEKKYEKRYPRCNKQDSPVKKSFIYKKCD